MDIMILGFHAIFSCYGFWLPNDPRGSWSEFVASWELFRYGPATKTTTRQSVAAAPHDVAARLAAKDGLKYPPVVLTDQQALAVAHGFADAIRQSGYHVLACAILPEHVHMVIGWRLRSIRRIVGHFKGRATHQLIKEKRWQGADRFVWGENGWNVVIDTLEHLQAAIAYVEYNPIKEGKKRQRWSFVTPLDSYLQFI